LALDLTKRHRCRYLDPISPEDIETLAQIAKSKHFSRDFHYLKPLPATLPFCQKNQALRMSVYMARSRQPSLLAWRNYSSESFGASSILLLA